MQDQVMMEIMMFVLAITAIAGVAAYFISKDDWKENEY